MSEPLKKVAAGDLLAIPAETFNTFIDMARDYRSRQVGVAQSPQPSRSSGIVLVKNASGADRNRFDVLGASLACCESVYGTHFCSPHELCRRTPANAECLEWQELLVQRAMGVEPTTTSLEAA